MKKTLATLALLGTLAGCQNFGPDQKAVIKNASYQPEGAITPATFSALVKIIPSGQEIMAVEHREPATFCHLKYKIGDTVTVSKYSDFLFEESYFIPSCRR